MCKLAINIYILSSVFSLEVTMALIDLNGYSDGATGSFTDGDGQLINYTVNHPDNNPDPRTFNGSTGLFLDDTQGLFGLTFDAPVAGIVMRLTANGGNGPEPITVSLDGAVVDVGQLVADGLAT